jgi:rRNA maturation RNase YbeY
MSEIELEIEFHLAAIEQQEQCELKQRMEHAARWVLQRFQKRSLTASISIVDDATIQGLNARHLQHDWPTDVISFAFESGERVNGEVIASWDTAQRLSQAAGWSAHDELILYVLHGLLHLIGLDDQQPEEQDKMRQAEAEYVRVAGFPGASRYLERFGDVSY